VTQNRKLAIGYFAGAIIYIVAAYTAATFLSTGMATWPDWLRTGTALLALLPLVFLAAKGLAAWNNEPN